jgi:uncharacterized protein (TIGR00725 family)
MYRLISVIGGSSASQEEYNFAMTLGRLLAGAGLSVVCGGGSGVMEAACRGCSEAGGFSLGILPGENSSQANGFISTAVPTGMGVSRNRIVALTGEVVCAVGGGYGTLSEIAFALQAGKHVCGFGRWENTPGVVSVSTPEEALEFVTDRIGVD